MSENTNTVVPTHDHSTVWDGIRDMLGGVVVASSDMHRPSMLVIDVNGVYERRWFGQKLPKNATPVGVVTNSGEFLAGTGVVLPRELAREIAVLHSIWCNQTRLVDDRFTEQEISDTVLAELVKLAKEKHSAAIPPWSYRLGLALTRETLQGLLAERRGRITDSRDVVVADYDRYDILDLIVWMADNYVDVTDEELARFLWAGAEFYGAQWIRLVWFRLTLRGENPRQAPARIRAAFDLLGWN
jgi:hypothetical protein